MNVTFPWPPKELSPNASLHWAAKGRAVKSYRKTCWVLAKEAKLKVEWEGPVRLTVNFTPPDKRAYDLDNLVARMKSGFDGLADALGINDRRFALALVAMTGPGAPSGVWIGLQP